MKLRLLSTVALVLTASAFVACATSEKTQIAGAPAVPGMPGDGTTTTPEESDDPALQPPHSLGTIILGEAHSTSETSGSTTATPIVSATFVPDALLTKTCKTALSNGCEIVKAPKCTKVKTSTTGCSTNEACTYDTSCSPVCKAFAVCQTSCSADEVCQAKTGTGTGTGTGTTTLGECVKTVSFDAGPIAFSGTTTSITMYPPYQFESTGQGAPFLGGAELKVQASGATEAGFEKFDETFTATTFLQTKPSLAKIPKSDIFGTGALPIAWVPANDTIIISLSGAGGTATCKVQDSLGKFDVPRSVVKAALVNDTLSTGTGTGSGTGSSSLSISVARQKRNVKKDKHAKGTLQLTSVKPDGWLELVTLSTESASFEGCAASEEICGDTCTDVSYDRLNCGACGNACSTSQSCYSGKCSGSSSSSGSTGTCSTCRSNAVNAQCSSYYSTCSGSTDCHHLAQCADACTTSSCVSSCQSSYPAGVSAYAGLKSCLTSYCSGSCGF